MGRTVKIFDTTLRDGEQSPGCSMNLNEKIEVAKQLEALKVDIIEAGFAAASPGDAAAIAAIADTVRGATICSLARCREQDIEAAWNSIRRAESARIHTFLATSPVHMEYKLKMTPEQVLESVAHNVAFAKKFCSDIEFSAEDATRSDLDFLCRVVETAIKAGATTINIPDTVGYMIPQEYASRIKYLREHTEGIENVSLSCHMHNDLGMAVQTLWQALKPVLTRSSAPSTASASAQATPPWRSASWRSRPVPITSVSAATSRPPRSTVQAA